MHLIHIGSFWTGCKNKNDPLKQKTLHIQLQNDLSDKVQLNDNANPVILTTPQNFRIKHASKRKPQFWGFCVQVFVIFFKQ